MHCIINESVSHTFAQYLLEGREVKQEIIILNKLWFKKIANSGIII